MSDAAVLPVTTRASTYAPYPLSAKPRTTRKQTGYRTDRAHAMHSQPHERILDGRLQPHFLVHRGSKHKWRCMPKRCRDERNGIVIDRTTKPTDDRSRAGRSM